MSSPRRPCPCHAPEKGGRLPTKCAAEFIGTFILVQTICLSANSFSIPAIPIGIVLAALVYQMGHISGAQFNPAVSLGIWIAGGQPLITTLVYWLAQFTGALLSGVVAAYTAKTTPESAFAEPMHPDMLMFASVDVENGDQTGIWTEFLFTFLLVSTVLNVAVTKSADYKNNQFFGIAIGFALMAGVAAGGSFSGGAYNPAVVCGVNTGHNIFARLQSHEVMGMGPLGNVGSPFARSWIIIIAADFLGGAVAAFWFLWTERGEGDEVEDLKHFAGDLGGKPLNSQTSA